MSYKASVRNTSSFTAVMALLLMSNLVIKLTKNKRNREFRNIGAEFGISQGMHKLHDITSRTLAFDYSDVL